MKPLKIIKSMQTTFDMLQEDMEEAKKMNDIPTFNSYMQALLVLKQIQDLVKQTIKEPVK